MAAKVVLSVFIKNVKPADLSVDLSARSVRTIHLSAHHLLLSC